MVIASNPYPSLYRTWTLNMIIRKNQSFSIAGMGLVPVLFLCLFVYGKERRDVAIHEIVDVSKERSPRSDPSGLAMRDCVFASGAEKMFR